MPAHRKLLVYLFIALIIFLCFSRDVQATRKIIIVSDKSSLFGEEEMTVTASASGFVEGETIYIKGAFYQDAPTPNYFGYTQKGDVWVKNSQPTAEQLSVKIGEWDNTLKVKSDFSDSGYKGEGDYEFKVGFYYTTSGGNLSSVQWSDNVLTVNLNEPDPTPTPTITPTPTPTSTPTPTLTPTPQPPTPTPTTKPSLTPTSTPIPSWTPTPTGGVLGEETASESGFYNLTDQEITPIENISTASGETEGKREFLFPILTAILGIGFISFSVFSFLKGRQPKTVV